MKIAYFGYDLLSSCLEVFLKQSHQFAVIYTGESSPYSKDVIKFAQENSIPLRFTQPSKSEMQSLVRQGVEMFFSAEYPHKIPLLSEMKYAINVHPTMLPEGRGMTPLPHLLLKHSSYAGITLHKLDNKFDNGDILLQKPITLGAHDTYDSLSAKIYQQMPSVLGALLADLDVYYDQSQKQGAGSNWPAITQAQQTLGWQQSTAELLTRQRAFGSLGVYAEIEGRACIINSAQGKSYVHKLQAGQVIDNSELHLTIACSDGAVRIPKASLIWLAKP